MSQKIFFYRKGMLQYHQSCICKAQNAFGEEIARLDYAHELLETAKERGKDHIKIEDWLEKIAKARTAGTLLTL